MKRLYSCAGLMMPLIASAAVAAEAGRPSTPELTRFSAYIERARAEFENVGMAVAVVKGDQVVFVQGFGLKQHGKPGRIDPDTLFQIGSTTKAFTGAALGALVDEGKLHWDDKVIDYLPGFRLQDPWLTRNLTVRDTVTHRSGIADSPYFVFALMNADQAMEQLRYIPAKFAFRDSYNYSNLMYGVAGQIAAAAAGTSWNQVVKSRLLQPLDMKRSGTSAYEFWDASQVTPTFLGSASADKVSYSDSRDPDVAMPHLLDEHGVPHVIAWQSYDNAAAAGTLVTSANDMAHWLIMNLNQGRFAGRQVLSADTVRELHAVQNLRTGPEFYDPGFPFQGAVQGYTIGWHRVSYHDQPLLVHGGGIIGFPAYAALMPEQKLGVVVLANSSQKFAADGHALRKAITLRAFDALLKVPLREWSQEFLARSKPVVAAARAKEQEREASRLKNTAPSLPLGKYVGDYEDRALHSGRLLVQLDGGQLTLRFAGAGAFGGVLDHWQRDVFRLHSKVLAASDFFASFRIDPNGNVTALDLFGAMFERVPTETH